MFSLGLEVFYQVAGQILLLIYSKTDSRTTGGLETVFNQETFMGIKMDPTLLMGISIAFTLKSCFTLHLKSIKTEKHFVPLYSSVFILMWGLFSSLRRILSIICLFIPSLGLFSILNHYKAEQILWAYTSECTPVQLYTLSYSLLYYTVPIKLTIYPSWSLIVHTTLQPLEVWDIN